MLNDPPRFDTENLPDFVDLEAALGADIVTFHTPLTTSGVSINLAFWVMVFFIVCAFVIEFALLKDD